MRRARSGFTLVRLMNALIAVLLLALLLLSGWLLWSLQQLQRQLTDMQSRVAAAPSLLPAAQAGRSRIAIEILNPFELAARETRLATAAAKLAPRMIERIVYERAAVQIAAQLLQQGVQAQVKAHVS